MKEKLRTVMTKASEFLKKQKWYVAVASVLVIALAATLIFTVSAATRDVSNGESPYSVGRPDNGQNSNDGDQGNDDGQGNQNDQGNDEDQGQDNGQGNQGDQGDDGQGNDDGQGQGNGQGNKDDQGGQGNNNNNQGNDDQGNRPRPTPSPTRTPTPITPSPTRPTITPTQTPIPTPTVPREVNIPFVFDFQNSGRQGVYVGDFLHIPGIVMDTSRGMIVWLNLVTSYEQLQPLFTGWGRRFRLDLVERYNEGFFRENALLIMSVQTRYVDRNHFRVDSVVRRRDNELRVGFTRSFGIINHGPGVRPPQAPNSYVGHNLIEVRQSDVAGVERFSYNMSGPLYWRDCQCSFCVYPR